MLKASRPLEYVCFFPFDIPTNEGEAYVYIAVDVFTGYLFQTGVERSREGSDVLKHIRLLIQDAGFQNQMANGFTIVFHKYHELTSQIEAILNPVGGKYIINEELVAEIVIPVIEELYEKMMDQS